MLVYNSSLSTPQPQTPSQVETLTRAAVLFHLQDSPASLTKALRWTYLTGGALTLVMLILWPILALPAGVFSQGYFTMCVRLRVLTRISMLHD